MAKVRIELKQKHIRRGKQCSAMNCPVFHALKDAGVEVYSVGPGYYRKNYQSAAINLPRRVVRFIDRFDELGPSGVQPFAFQLEV